MYFIVGLWYNKPTIKLFLEEVRYVGSEEEKYTQEGSGLRTKSWTPEGGN